MLKKGKKNKDKFSEKYIYSVDKVFDSSTTGTTTSAGSSSDNCPVKSKWVISDAPKTIEEKMENLGKSFKKVSKKSGVKFCQTCGNMFEKGLDKNFCSAECKYKYCEIEDEADKHSE